jgi:predicted DNA-binding transcriptional regulator YafY
MPRSDSLAVLENIPTIPRSIRTSRGVTRKALAEEPGHSPKTVKRYLGTLDRAGLHLETDEQGRLKRYVRLNPESHPGNPLELIALTRGELTHLHLHLAGIHYAGDPALREALWRSIRNALGGEPVAARRLSATLTAFDKACKSYDRAETRAVLGTLLEALCKSCVCRVSYRTPERAEPRTDRIEPCLRVEFDGGLYCYARVPCHDSVILLAVERMQALELDKDTFEKRPAVAEEIVRKKARAFRILDDGQALTVSLRFRPAVAFHIAERTWHPSEEKTWHEDGSPTMAFTATGPIEIERWIRDRGEDVEGVGMAG